MTTPSIVQAANAASYRLSHVLLDNAANTTEGAETAITVSGEYILNMEGSFATAATVNIYVKRLNSDDFILLKSLDTGLSAQYSGEGDVSLLFSKGDIVYAQLSGITGTPAVSVKLNFVKS